MLDTDDSVISFILDEQIVDRAILEAAVEKSESTGRSLISLLKSDGIISQDQLTRVVAVSNKIEFVNLSPDMIDPIAARLVSYDMAVSNSLIPVRIEKGQLLVAMSSPLNLSVRDQLSTRTGYKVVPLAATAEAIRQAITYHFDVRNVTKQDIVSMRLKGSREVSPVASKAAQKTSQLSDAPVARLVDSIINGAIDTRASDIHLEPQEPDMRVRYRIDGMLRDTVEVPASVQREVISHIKVLAEMDIAEKRMPQDGHISVNHHGKLYDLRVSSLPAIGGEKIVIRILDKNAGVWKLEELFQIEDDKKKVMNLIQNPYGMILVTGPTGSGKTTTLYSILQELNVASRNIVTVEDPVEYRLNGITQVQIKPTAGLTFATGLRSILRQDPNVVLVGEIRDYETAEIAVSAALTGHLVLSTLHTNDASGAISRLINIGIPAFLVASSLRGVLAQRLVRTICPDCRRQYDVSASEVPNFQIGKEAGETVTLNRGVGCKTCGNTGYLGRGAVYEILTVSEIVKEMIISNTSDISIRKQAITEGMQTLKREGIRYVLEGVTTVEELLRVVDIRGE